LTCAFDGVRAGFHHPLGPGEGHAGAAVLSFPSGQEVTGFEVLEGELEKTEETVQPILRKWPGAWDSDLKWRAAFFAHWRLWPYFAAERDGRFAFLPADTRLPDHTIWTHNAVVAALAGCAELPEAASALEPEEWVRQLRNAPLRPAFLKFQLGPVQEFIAQTRSTRDLWSGSYLLSWLMAAGLKALSAEVGPDAVIFPKLCGQPLFDLHWREELWGQVQIGEQPVWDSLRDRARRARCRGGCGANNPDLDLLTPNLPNVFLAVVPENRANELGKLVADAMRKEWMSICQSVWDKVANSGLLDLCPPELKPAHRAKARFDAQVQRLWSVSWHVLPWPKDLAEAKSMAQCLPQERPLPGERSLLQRFDTVVHAATQAMPRNDRDPRYYVGGADGPKDVLNNIGLGWALLAAVSGWRLDAVRQTRDFKAWSSSDWRETGVAQSKDALTGREEMLFGGRGFADRVAQLPDREWSGLFKHDDEIGAITLVKRVWHWSYLAEAPWCLKARRGQFPMPNTRSLAAHKPSADDAEDNLEAAGDESEPPKYFAVLALDGDEIGKWVSGDKAPRYQTQFASYEDTRTEQGGGQQGGSLEYFTRDRGGQGGPRDPFADLLQTRRLVSPSYHLQFSEALSNFALLCARPIVKAFDGILIFAGGDDVLAMLPADTALACARALRAAFRGVEVKGRQGRVLFRSLAPGFLASDVLASDGWIDQQRHPIPFLVPGQAADCSVGIAIAHFKDPLQDVIREAQAAEKRAKSEMGRGAVAVTLLKRSGEAIHWGCQWNSGGLELYDAMLKAVAARSVSSRFPHRLVELLDGYLTQTTPLAAKSFQPLQEFPVSDIVRRELCYALDRQAQEKSGAAFRHLAGLAHDVNEGQDRTTVESYLDHVRQRAAATHAGRPANTLDERARIEGPVSALIGLCQTVAFIARNLPDTADSTADVETSNHRSETPLPAERQPTE
jgi:hypothetical protein